MSPETIAYAAMAEGVTLQVTPDGAIKAAGCGETVARWLPQIREHKDAIAQVLRAPLDSTWKDLPVPEPRACNVTAREFLEIAAADGVLLAWDGSRLKARGEPAAIERWSDTLAVWRQELIAHFDSLPACGVAMG